MRGIAKGVRGLFSGERPVGIRWHLLLGYLLVIWVTLALLMLSLSRSLEATAVGSRRAYLFAQAHLIASAIRARGGPAVARLSAIGGVPLQGRVLVLDGTGRVLEDSAADPEMVGRVLDLPEVAGALRGKESANTYYLPDGTFAMYVAVPSAWDETGGAVFIAQDLADVVQQYRNVMTMVLTGGVLASAAVLVVAALIANVVAGPVLELARNARRLAAGRLDVRVKPRGPRETRILGEAFNSMAEEIERTITSHEQFMIAAAHELRSPLASMSVLVESMKMKTPSPGELPELLDDLESGIMSLTRVSEGFLDLLRVTDKGVGTRESEGKELGEVVARVLSDRAALAREKKISVETMMQGIDGARVSVDPVLFRFVVSNLIDNALKFTPERGCVRVVLTAGAPSPDGPPRQGDLTFEVSDTGPGIPPEHIPRIFERFYRVDKARARATGGTGLGLAIVKEACDRSGGIVAVESEVGKGSTFRVLWRDAVTYPDN